MAYAIHYKPSAAKTIRKLDRQTARRLVAAIAARADDPRPPGSLQLVGGEGEFRIRDGAHRVIHDIEDNVLIVLVLKVGHRRDVYR